MQKLQSEYSVSSMETDKIKALYWDKKYTVEEIANNLHISFWKLYNLMKKYNINRRDRSEAGYISANLKPQFKIKPELTIADEKLKIAGVMLYWAEGTLKGSTVDFANSNPQIIRIFLKFLRQICGVSEERLRVYLYGYQYHNLETLKAYWHSITRVPFSQFTKPYIRKDNPNLSNRKLPYGLIHIRYNDKRLLNLIKEWIDEYIDWAGTQVAKRGRLCKSSVLPKGRMEK